MTEESTPDRLAETLPFPRPMPPLAAREARASSSRVPRPELSDVHASGESSAAVDATAIGPPAGALAANPLVLAIPGYRLYEIVGSGASSWVFRADQVSVQRRVALKVLKPDAANPQQRERFFREASLLAKLADAHIPAVYDAGRAASPGALALEYIALEWIDGPNLKEIFERQGPFTELEALHLLRDLGQTLATLDQHHLIHRDIKPANIVRSGDVHMLVDFGLGKDLASDDSLTVVGARMGTPRYMAPELISNAKFADIRADIFSLGATVYWLVTGHPPYVAASFDELLLAQKHQPPVQPAILRPELSAEFSSLILSMLSFDPKDRPSSPDDLLRRVDSLRVRERHAEASVVPAQFHRESAALVEPEPSPPLALCGPKLDDFALRRPKLRPPRLARAAQKLALLALASVMLGALFWVTRKTWLTYGLRLIPWSAEASPTDGTGSPGVEVAPLHTEDAAVTAEFSTPDTWAQDFWKETATGASDWSYRSRFSATGWTAWEISAAGAGTLEANIAFPLGPIRIKLDSQGCSVTPGGQGQSSMLRPHAWAADAEGWTLRLEAHPTGLRVALRSSGSGTEIFSEVFALPLDTNPPQLRVQGTGITLKSSQLWASRVTRTR